MTLVITGARKGIGRYLAEYYTAAGHMVFGCSRMESDYHAPNYEHFIADVTDEKAVARFASSIRKSQKSIDVLINNAGAASMNHFLLTPGSTAKNLMELNYIGAFNCSRAFINLLRKSEQPRIVNFTSVAVPLSLAGEIAYVASKGALEAFTKVLARDLANFRITVNAIGPTPIETDLIKNVPEEKLEELIKQQIVKRTGRFSDVSNLLDFFISPNSDFITGQIVYLGGVLA